MRNGIRLGRLAGFPLAMDWSVLLIVGLVTWSTSTLILPEAAPGYAPMAYWLAGLLGALLFFVSLLAHELGHALLARRAGIEVAGLTLWLLGGVATLRGEAGSPRDDLRIAGIGPAVSLALAAFFAGLTELLLLAGVSQLVHALTSWLAVVNLMLGVFNLIPGAPLDGGRILRAWLWSRWGDRQRAARAAARAGQRTGLVLIWLGLLEVLVLGSVSGLWLCLIGWFVVGAAKAEEVASSAGSALADLRVADVMTADPVSVPSWATVADVGATPPPGHAHAAYPVVGLDGRVTGLVMLARLVRVPREARASTRVSDIAEDLEHIPTAGPDEPLVDVAGRLTQAHAACLLVLDDGQLVGIVTPRDIANTADLRLLAAPRQDGLGLHSR